MWSFAQVLNIYGVVGIGVTKGIVVLTATSDVGRNGAQPWTTQVPGD